MGEFFYLVVGLVFGFFVNEFLSGAFGGGWAKKFGKQFKPRGAISRIEVINSGFNIGKRRTDIFMVQGDGVYSYSPDSLRATYVDGSPVSPDDIADRIHSKECAIEIARENGDMNVWPGIGVGIEKYETLLDENEESLGINIRFYKTFYPAFQATVLEIGKEDRTDPKSIYQNYLATHDPRNVIPFLARHVGVVAVVVSADDVIVAVKRGSKVHARPNEFDVSIVEGIDPTKDADVSGGRNTIDIYRTIARGCEEELGFRPNSGAIEVLGFGVDLRYYQYNFFSIVKADRTFDEIQRLRNGRARDEWETELVPINNSIGSVLSFIDRNPMWDTAVAAFYWQLVFENGKHLVEARAAQIFNKN